MIKLLISIIILMVHINAKESIIKEDEKLRVKKNYFSNGILSDVLFELKGTDIFAVLAYYKTGELSCSIIGYRKTSSNEMKVITRTVFSKNGEIKCNEKYMYYHKIVSYADMISDKREGYRSFESSNYLSDLIYFANNEFKFPKLKKHTISNFKSFIQKTKMYKTVQCKYSGIKLNIKYEKSLLLDEDIFKYGSIETILSTKKSIKNSLEAENLITKYFKKDRITFFGIDTRLSF